MKYWQISAGDGSVDLSDIFIKLNVALQGPGDYGDYFDNRILYKDLGTSGKVVKTFAEDVKIGDRLILKRKKLNTEDTSEIVAVGEVLGPYRYEPVFSDVELEGLGLQHCRRVKWYVPKEEILAVGPGALEKIEKLEEDNPMIKKGEEILLKYHEDNKEIE
ncbi:hypothetical protein [Clostridium chrysemydis]|uniref:hypothetical protein n=1 Tax=Clostridium chrysemydis TaxID=2665504 RepID=UPI00188355A8|nr:hypothetical protein [Clostridium chrysemydis]